MADKEITYEVLKCYDTQNVRNNNVKIQIVRWGKYAPTLEKREFFIDSEGKEKTGKAKGFNAGDFQILLNNADEIADLLDKK